MQTRDKVEGLHDCLEFSQPLECFYQAMQAQEKSLPVALILLFRKILLLCRLEVIYL